jgi:hypothetical protein
VTQDVYVASGVEVDNSIFLLTVLTRGKVSTLYTSPYIYPVYKLQCTSVLLIPTRVAEGEFKSGEREKSFFLTTVRKVLRCLSLLLWKLLLWIT